MRRVERFLEREFPLRPEEVRSLIKEKWYEFWRQRHNPWDLRWN